MFVCSEHRGADQTGIIAERGQDQLGIRVAAEGLLRSGASSFSP